MYSERQELHDTLLRLALGESKKCVPSPTAFSVGAVIFLPRSTVTSKTDTNHLDELHTLLEPFFPTLIGAAAGTDEDEGQEDPGVEVQGLILSSSYSRALEGNTHAEANALTLLERKIPGLPLQVQQSVLALTGTRSSEQEALPGAVYQAILSRSWMYATMEPCSRRTSGLRSCTEAILASSLKRVYIVSISNPYGTRKTFPAAI
jgi:pyrimidine deaminase RibD-like protein